MAHINLTVSSLNEKGYGVGTKDGRTYYILNALPGEEIIAEIYKRKRGVSYGSAIKTITRSEQRVEPVEEHFLACSPWQILDFKTEQETKKNLIQSFYKKEAEYKLPEFEVAFRDKEYAYRNKIEFSFYGTDERIDLAFHKREAGKAKYSIKECALAPKKVNEAAKYIIEILNKAKVTAWQLKNLLLRYSFFTNQVIAALYVKNADFDIQIFENQQELLNQVSGLHIFYSDPKSPTLLETKRLFRYGAEEIHEQILNLDLTYPFNGFFQVNPEVFELAAQDIINYVKSIENNKGLIAADFYGGVGTIGLLASPYLKKVVCVELFNNAEKYAIENARKNSISNFEFVESSAEKSEDTYLKSSEVIIVDPPRPGLHPKFLKKLIEEKPKHIIYLSCNPKTQAENFKELKEFYSIEFFKAYNFYPHTPHIESLLILKNSMNN